MIIPRPDNLCLFSTQKMILRFFLSFLFLISQFAQAAEFINVKEEDRALLLKKYPSLAKDKPSYSILDLAIKELSEIKRYEYAKAVIDGSQIKIIGIPAKRIRSIKFIGNENFSADQLLKISKLKVNSDFSKQEINFAVKRIKNAYIKQSYLNTFIDIEVKSEGDQKQFYSLSVKITENEICKIKEILFLSDNQGLNADLEKHVRKYIKDPLHEKKLEEIEAKIRKYLKKRQFYFSDLEATSPEYNKNKNLATLYFKVNNSYKYEFYYEGNESITRAELTSRLKDLYASNWSTDPVNKIIENIRNLYNEKGFIKAQVKLVTNTDKKDFIRRLTFTIIEGKRVKIDSIQFGGRFSAKEESYIDFIFANSPDPIGKKYYTPDSLDKGIDNLIANMKNTGFLHAKHISTRVKYKKDYLVDVTIIINEGPTTRIKSVKFSGNNIITNQELINQTQLKKDLMLNLKIFEDSLRSVSRYYYSLGFIEMEFENLDTFIKYSKNNTLAEINYKIKEGPQVKVNNIQIEGNDFTEDYVILREIQIREGEILSAEKLVDAQTNLTRLGLFTSVDIRTSEAGTNVGSRTLLITVTERKPGLFKLGIGASNDRGVSLRGYTGASYNNLFGTARAIYARLDAQVPFEQENSLDKVWKVSAGYVEPYLFNTLIRGRVKTEIERDVIGTGDELKTTSNRRIGFLLENDLTRHVKAVWTMWSLDSQTQTLQLTSLEERVDVAIIGPSLTFDSRDNPFLPTKGIYSKLELQYSAPLLGSSDDAHFLKTEGNFTTYLKLFTPKLIWANSLRGGYISKVGERSGGGIPEDNMFFLGGHTTIRGFGGTSNLERLPSSAEFPRDRQIIETDYAHYGLLKSELRFPIYGNSGGVIFWDAGQVIVGGFEFKQALRQSFGIGYRYNTPVGPLVVDIAVKDSTVFDGEKPLRLHISIGTF